MTIFSSNENELVRMMGQSSRKIPYTTQVATPVIKTKSIHFEISSAFFSLMVLINCGSSELAVQMPAIKPITCVQLMFLLGKAFAMFFFSANSLFWGLKPNSKQVP